MSVRTYQVGSRKQAGQGLRLGAVRFLPRGVRKRDYARFNMFDVWTPVLAPSRKLLRWARGKEWSAKTRKQFFSRYAREMESQTDARQMIQFIAKLGRRTPLSVGCYCADESLCHRSVLIKLVRKAKNAAT